MGEPTGDLAAAIVELRQSPLLGDELLGRLSADPVLAERLSVDAKAAEIVDQARLGRLVQSLLRTRLDRSKLSRFIGNVIFYNGGVRHALFSLQRWQFYSDLVREELSNGLPRDVPLGQLIEMAQHLFDMGRPELVLDLMKKAGPAAPASELGTIAARALALQCRGVDALRLLRVPGNFLPSAMLRRRYLEGWLLFHRLNNPSGAEIIRHSLQQEILLQGFPELAWMKGGMKSAACSEEDVEPALSRLLQLDPKALDIVAADPAIVPAHEEPLGLPFLDRARATAPYAELLDGTLPPLQTLLQRGEALGDFYHSHVGELLDYKLRSRLQRHWQMAAHLSGRLAMVSPFSGDLMLSRHSIAVTPTTLLHCFVAPVADQSFYVLGGGWNVARKDLLLVPSRNLALRLNAETDMPPPAFLVTEALQFVGRHRPLVTRFLQRPASPALSFGVIQNIGHHYHNELSGLWHIRERLSPKLPIVLGRFDYYDATRLPEVAAKRSPLYPATGERASLLCLERGWSPFRALDVAAPSALAAAVSQHLAPADPAAPASEPAVLFMLRSNRRVWRSQSQQLPLLIRHLAERHGIRRILLDGVTLTAPGDRDEAAWIAAEQSIAAGIIADTAGVARVESIIGLPAAEKLRRHRAVILGIAPKGNGLVPNLQWIRNLLCIVHGNAQDIRFAPYEATYRDDATLPLLVDRDGILDPLADRLDAGEDRFGVEDQLSLGYDLDAAQLIRLIDEAFMLIRTPAA